MLCQGPSDGAIGLAFQLLPRCGKRVLGSRVQPDGRETIRVRKVGARVCCVAPHLPDVPPGSSPWLRALVGPKNSYLNRDCLPIGMDNYVYPIGAFAVRNVHGRRSLQGRGRWMEARRVCFV